MEKKIVIESERQENGLWGMPLQVTYIDGWEFQEDPAREELFSAILAAFAQVHPEPFGIYFLDQKGFKIKKYHNHSGKIWYGIRFEDYSLEDNALVYDPKNRAEDVFQ